MTESYLELAPRTALRDYVACTWVATVQAAADDDRGVLPDGCVDIIFADDREPFVAGPDTEARPVEMPAGTKLVAIRFLPGAAAALLGTPVCEFTDRTIPLSCAWPSRAVHELRHRVAEAGSPLEMAGRLEESIARRVLRSAEPDLLVRDAIDAILRVVLRGGLSPKFHFDLSERQLRRRFVTSVGYGPKTFARIARFRQFMRIARTHRELGLAGLAAEAGYADQSHLTRECARLARRTPRNLLNTTATSDLFKTIA